MRTIIVVLFLLQLITILSAQETVVFSELDTKFEYLLESDETPETDLQLQSDIYLDRADLTMKLSNLLRQYIGDFEDSNFFSSFSLEKRMGIISNYSMISYENNALDTLRFVNVYTQLLRSRSSRNVALESSLDLNWQNLLNLFNYNIISGSINLGKKNYFRSFSLHQSFIFNLNQVHLRSAAS
ncbi:hypothetical protein ACFLYK_03410, partial [Candidatus Cloacimonadota bacterium]